MSLTDKQLSKLRLPLHISYIQNNLLKVSEDQTRELLKTYIESGIIEESKYGKDYYLLTSEYQWKKK